MCLTVRLPSTDLHYQLSSTLTSIERLISVLPLHHPTTDPRVQHPIHDPPVQLPIHDPPVQLPITDLPVQLPTLNQPIQHPILGLTLQRPFHPEPEHVVIPMSPVQTTTITQNSNLSRLPPTSYPKY